MMLKNQKNLNLKRFDNTTMDVLVNSKYRAPYLFLDDTAGAIKSAPLRHVSTDDRTSIHEVQHQYVTATLHQLL